ncbi:WSC domain-containing protein-like protein 5 [Colletotrichum chlorophyti]|uniref:WSC domain-containing protein-like protein 5 n=1 Tax=Colletotrichum chlorophyti TaxID=708187 RepID=A0A1Q8RJI5_9PEZI|nr:WSC domain-containing protein-like protein 5 [Colletotrichum chlorophyti]
MKLNTSLLLGFFGLALQANADPTWPSSIDELEEIMFQTFSFRSRNFAAAVNPCTKQVNGAGRNAAAEWLRTAFHDMATGSASSRVGGLDASLQYELSSTENKGPAFATTLTFMAPYLTSKSSMADLIALGVYTSVLSCGGPSVDIRAGRIDAKSSGPIGVPQPENSIQIFMTQFGRMGFSPQEMIQVTACGHTLGGVHAAENPDIVPSGQFPDNVANFDTTTASFDNRVVTEYLNNTTKNPLVFTPGTGRARNSDLKVFNWIGDTNITMRALADAAVFRTTCKAVFEKMINLVPSNVVLTDAIKPYQVKPVELQLVLTSPTVLRFTGYIRIRTTGSNTGIASVTINYKNRNGGTTCGSSSCTFTMTQQQGLTKGLEDTFAWYPISQNVPVSSGISSFTVTINRSDGSSTLFDNNGNGYPIQDGVFLQTDQSCLIQNSGDGTFVAAVRNDRASLPVKLAITYASKRTSSVVPSLTTVTLDMTKGECHGSYTFFSVTTNIPGGLSYQSTMDVISGEGASAMVDSFKKANPIGGTCQAWAGGSATCASITVSASGTSSALPNATPYHRQTVGGYRLVSCWSEPSGARALTGASYAYDGMTLESCMANCTGFDYWGTEYGRECYCGNSLDASSASAPLGDCNMLCSGDSTQYCGAGFRIELYSTTATRTSTSTPAPTATLAHIPTIGKYSLVGCQTEAEPGLRALGGAATASDDMTLEKCAAFCSDFTYFGTEYSKECYCGNSILGTSKPAPIGECNMKCAGNPYQYCGDGNRLELSSGSVASSDQSPTSTLSTSTSTVPTLAQKPTVLPFTLKGCWTEASNGRALSQKSYTSGDNMTLEACASYCSDYKYFGTEYGSECYCGNFLGSSSSEAPLTDCSMTCSGNKYEYCGAGNRLTLYQSEKQIEGPSQPATAGAYTYLGCRTEPAEGGRALGLKSTGSGQMTNEVCAAFCDGYAYFGTEYGAECWCGDSLPETSLVAPQGDCSMLCSGSQSEFCGNGNRLSVYKK